MAIFSKMAAKGIFAILPEMFKDHKGKWSSKRTVSGVLAIAAVATSTHKELLGKHFAWL